jgi:hypothetical protein
VNEPAWIPEEVWRRTPRQDATHYEVVYDEDLGALAQATHPDGTVTYGTDPPARKP